MYVLLFMTALIVIIDGIDQYTTLQSSDISFGQIMVYVLIRIPNNLYQFVPLLILISTLVFFLNLSRHSEIIALKAAGISAAKIVLVPVIITIIISFFLIGSFNNLLVGSRKLSDEYADRFQARPSQTVRTVNDGVWLREVIKDETRFIYVPSVNWQEQTFNNIEFYIIKSGEQIKHLIGKTARISNQQWEISSVEVFKSGKNQQTLAEPSLTLSTNQNFSNIFSSLIDAHKVKTFRLSDFIARLEKNGYDVKSVKTYYYSELFLPVFLTLMVLIGSVFALSPMRGGGTSKRVIYAIASGFICYGATKLTESMAKSGDIPIIVGVGALPIAGIFLAIALLLHQEDG